MTLVTSGKKINLEAEKVVWKKKTGHIMKIFFHVSISIVSVNMLTFQPSLPFPSKGRGVAHKSFHWQIRNLSGLFIQWQNKIFVEFSLMVSSVSDRYIKIVLKDCSYSQRQILQVCILCLYSKKFVSLNCSMFDILVYNLI